METSQETGYVCYDASVKPGWDSRVTSRMKAEGESPAPKRNEEVKAKLLKVDSAVQFQTEPNTTRIYGSGYLNIETTDLEDGRTRMSRIKETDIILYKIMTTGPRKFLVRPNSGILRSRQYACIQIRTLEEETAKEIEKYKFQVQALVIPPDHKILASEAGDNFSQDRMIGTLTEKLKSTDELLALWNELVRIPGTYVERHKVLVQIHPVVEDSNPSLGRELGQRRRRVQQASFLQIIGIAIAGILLCWVATKLFPLHMFQPLIAGQQQDDPSTSAHAPMPKNDGEAPAPASP